MDGPAWTGRPGLLPAQREPGSLQGWGRTLVALPNPLCGVWAWGVWNPVWMGDGKQAQGQQAGPRATQESRVRMGMGTNQCSDPQIQAPPWRSRGGHSVSHLRLSSQATEHPPAPSAPPRECGLGIQSGFEPWVNHSPQKSSPAHKSLLDMQSGNARARAGSPARPRLALERLVPCPPGSPPWAPSYVTGVPTPDLSKERNPESLRSVAVYPVFVRNQK